MYVHACSTVYPFKKSIYACVCAIVCMLYYASLPCAMVRSAALYVIFTIYVMLYYGMSCRYVDICLYVSMGTVSMYARRTYVRTYVLYMHIYIYIYIYIYMYVVIFQPIQDVLPIWVYMSNNMSSGFSPGSLKHIGDRRSFGWGQPLGRSFGRD